MEKRRSRVDLAKSIGQRNYTVLEKDHQELLQQLDQHPLTSGLWAIGNYFVMIGDVKIWKTIYLSESVEPITGYAHTEAFEMGAELLVQLTHPEDFPILMANNQKAVQFLYEQPAEERPYCTCTHYYRGIRKDKTEFVIQHQSFPVGFDAYGMPYVFANVITDITHLHLSPLPRTFLLNRKSDELTEIKSTLTDHQGLELKISHREKEVLGWLMKGLSSKEIADKMDISFHTVQTYRKRLLEKTQVKNTSELVNFAFVHSLV